MSRNTKKIAYCTLDPDFPEIIYMVIMFMPFQGRIDIIPMFQVFVNRKEASEVIKETNKMFTRKDLSLPEVCSLFELHKRRLYPLKKEYWTGKHLSYTHEERKLLFIKLMRNPEMYELLVTPSHYYEKENKWMLTADLPLTVGTSDKVIENFMYASDSAVNEKAKNAALADFLGSIPQGSDGVSYARNLQGMLLQKRLA